MSRARSVLVTGGTGFIGTPTVEALRLGGWDVHLLGRREPRDLPGVMWHSGDLLAGSGFETTVSGIGASHLLHLAWCATPGQFWNDPANLQWLGATTRLISAFADGGGRHIVGLGSSAEYDWSYGWCREAGTPLAPSTLYGCAKAAAGSVLVAWAERMGLTASWARLFQVYGPGEPGGRLVSSLVEGLREGRRIPLSAGDQVRDFIHVDDVARVLVHLLQTDGMGAVNVGTGVGARVRDVAAMLGTAAGAPHLLGFGALGAAKDAHPLVVADITRIRSTGWAPGVALEDGLAALLRDGL